MVTGNFMAEFNDATFAGDISGLDGTFSGTLTAQAVNAVSNLNVLGGAVAITSVSFVDKVNGFDDDSIWRDVSTLRITVPAGDSAGGWALIAIQYTLSDLKGDNDTFPVSWRIWIDNEVVYTTPVATEFGGYYNIYRHFSYELIRHVSAGPHDIALQFKWDNAATNMYAEFTDVTIRADYIRK